MDHQHPYSSSADEKPPLPTTLPEPQSRRLQEQHNDGTNPRGRQLITRVIPAILTVVALLSLFRAVFVCHHHYNPDLRQMHVDVLEESDKINLEAHVMSKCPDARDCLHDLIIPTMVQVSDKVNFTMSFIGSIDPNSDAVACKHGPSECLGNIILLCAATVYPDVKLWLGFANCMIADYPDIPQRELVEGCAMEHGLDFSKLNSCISDEGEGIDLLRSSIERSRENNVTKSCTVRLAGEVRCIRDGGEWYDCPGGSSVDDLVRDIDDLYNRGNI